MCGSGEGNGQKHLKFRSSECWCQQLQQVLFIESIVYEALNLALPIHYFHLADMRTEDCRPH